MQIEEQRGNCNETIGITWWRDHKYTFGSCGTAVKKRYVHICMVWCRQCYIIEILNSSPLVERRWHCRRDTGALKCSRIPKAAFNWGVNAPCGWLTPQVMMMSRLWIGFWWMIHSIKRTLLYWNPKFCIGFKIRKNNAEQFWRSGFGYSKGCSSAALHGVIWDWVEQ